MCGIGGCLGDGASRELMRKMSQTVRHRGSDDYGDFVDTGVGLFNNRLSIIDIQGGHQPIFNEAGTVAVTFNGEIYNFPDLRRDLQAKGHRFATNSDTEVIVHGYEEYGPSVFSRLNGMFAIALWDAEKRRLLLARDRVGIKPLYYSRIDGDLIFCSEVKGILCHSKVEPTVNRAALYSLVSLHYIPFELTLINGILKVPPGHYYDSLGGVMRYWIPGPTRPDYIPAADMVARVIEESVKRQLISDVPVGSFLSGGLDTSTIVAFASRHYGAKLKTFCMGFGHEDDELEDARLVADHFGTEHYDFTIDDRAMIELYPRMIWHSEQPKLNTYNWFANEYASRHVKVCLSGLGGDELFFGYPNSTRFVNFLRVQRLARLPGSEVLALILRGRRRQLIANVKNRPRAYLTIISATYGHNEGHIFSFPLKEIESYRQELTERMGKSFFTGDLDFVQQSVYAEFFTKLPDDYLTIEDSMSMAHTMENRVPLLDNELLDLMLPVHYRHNYEGRTGKMLLRAAMRGILPRRCFEKPKQGFSLNIVKWWKGELGEEIRRVLPESETVKAYFNTDKLTEMMRDAADSYGKVSILWHIYAFEIWHRLFIEDSEERKRFN